MTRRTATENVMGKRVQALLFAAFPGFMIGSAGVAVFPDLAVLATPLACRGGSIVTTTSHFSQSPGVSGTQTRVACIEASGERTEVGGYATLAIAAELYVPFAVIGWWVSAQIYPAHRSNDDDDGDDDVRRRRRDDDDD